MGHDAVSRARRVELDTRTVSSALVPGLAESEAGTLTLQTRSTDWWFFLVVVALLLGTVSLLLLQLGMGLPLVGILFGTLVVMTLIFLAVNESGSYLTRAWRFSSARIDRELRLAVPSRLVRQHFTPVTEIEILHTIYYYGVFGRRTEWGHADKVRFNAVVDHAVPIRERSTPWLVSTAKIRGGNFTSEQAREIEAEIHPEILELARVLARSVGAPLYVVERAFWTGPTQPD